MAFIAEFRGATSSTKYKFVVQPDSPNFSVRRLSSQLCCLSWRLPSCLLSCESSPVASRLWSLSRVSPRLSSRLRCASRLLIVRIASVQRHACIRRGCRRCWGSGWGPTHPRLLGRLAFLLKPMEKYGGRRPSSSRTCAQRPEKPHRGSRLLRPAALSRTLRSGVSCFWYSEDVRQVGGDTQSRRSQGVEELSFRSQRSNHDQAALPGSPQMPPGPQDHLPDHRGRGHRAQAAAKEKRIAADPLPKLASIPFLDRLEEEEQGVRWMPPGTTLAEMHDLSMSFLPCRLRPLSDAITCGGPSA